MKPCFHISCINIEFVLKSGVCDLHLTSLGELCRPFSMIILNCCMAKVGSSGRYKGLVNPLTRCENIVSFIIVCMQTF